MCNWNRCMRILMGFPGFLSGASKSEWWYSTKVPRQSHRVPTGFTGSDYIRSGIFVRFRV